MFDAIVVGSGFSGAVISHELASNGKKVLVLEKRNHIGGNMYDEFDSNGFLIQQYGPHILYTNELSVVNYLSQFSDLVPFECHMLSLLDGKYIHLPFNFQSIQELVGVNEADLVIKGIRNNFDCKDRISIFTLMQAKDKHVSAFANLLFKKAFETYICKQWGLKPNQIDRSIIDRVKFTPNFTSRYLNSDYQFLPKEGFTKLISNMLNNPNITIKLQSDATKELSIENGKIWYKGESIPVFYSGSLDELFKYKYGPLPYRSIAFQTKYYKQRQVLPCPIISMPQDSKLNRKTEYKFFSPFVTHKEDLLSIVVSEEPNQHDYRNSQSIQCYPIINEPDSKLYSKYLIEAKKVCNLYLCGRLAEYKYYNMDAVILHSLNVSQSFLNLK